MVGVHWGWGGCKANALGGHTSTAPLMCDAIEDGLRRVLNWSCGLPHAWQDGPLCKATARNLPGSGQLNLHGRRPGHPERTYCTRARLTRPLSAFSSSAIRAITVQGTCAPIQLLPSSRRNLWEQCYLIFRILDPPKRSRPSGGRFSASNAAVLARQLPPAS